MAATEFFFLGGVCLGSFSTWFLCWLASPGTIREELDWRPVTDGDRSFGSE